MTTWCIDWYMCLRKRDYIVHTDKYKIDYFRSIRVYKLYKQDHLSGRMKFVEDFTSLEAAYMYALDIESDNK